MKNLRSIASFALALLVLVSSSSFMVGMHICGGEIQNITLFTKSDGCEMEKKLPPCHRQKKSPCCDDKTIVHEGQDFNTSFSEVSAPPVSFVAIAAPAILVSEVIPVSNLQEVKPFKYDTPLPTCDLTVAHRVFLI